MLFFFGSQFRRRLASLSLLSVLLGMAPSGGRSLQGISGGTSVGIQNLIRDVFRTNNTVEILLQLEEKRLQVEENLTLSEDIDTNGTILPFAANGCDICQCTTFLRDKIST